MSKPAFSVKRAYGDACVRISVALSSHGYGPSVSVNASHEISTAEARELAKNLIAEADRADAAAAKKQAEKGRRAQYTEREIAAGRMVKISATEFFRRGQS